VGTTLHCTERQPKTGAAIVHATVPLRAIEFIGLQWMVSERRLHEWHWILVPTDGEYVRLHSLPHCLHAEQLLGACNAT
jgi:hypothetical protein